MSSSESDDSDAKPPTPPPPKDTRTPELLQNVATRILMKTKNLKLRVIDIFHKIDSDRSGKISADELGKGIHKALKIRLKPEEARLLLASVDTDGDGNISSDELAAVIVAAEDAVQELALRIRALF